MTLSRRSTLLKSGAVGGAVLGIALALAATAGGSSLAATAQGGSGCSATPHVSSQWGSGPTGGEVVTVTVANTSTTTGTQWTVGWMLATGQRIVNSWNATVSASGTAATAVNQSYNGKLAPGASTTFGMELAGTGQLSGFTCANDAVGTSPSRPASSPPTSVSPGTGRTVTVTTADNGSSISLHVGDMLVVSLPAMYQPPTVAQAGVLSQLDVTGGYPQNLPLIARYLAAAAGSADISTLTDSACNHAPTPCPSPQVPWRLHVTVVSASASASSSASSGTGRTVTVTTADNQSSISLRVGDTLVVSLPAMYQPPTVAQAGALTPLDVNGGYPTGVPLVARYLAAAPGSADISTLTDSACNHAPTPCPSPAVRWTLHVTVGT